MKRKTKVTIIGFIALLALLAVIIIGGYYERGYYAVGSEIIAAPLGLFLIGCERNQYF